MRPSGLPIVANLQSIQRRINLLELSTYEMYTATAKHSELRAVLEQMCDELTVYRAQFSPFNPCLLAACSSKPNPQINQRQLLLAIPFAILRYSE